MPCARSRWAFAGVPANPATRMPCRFAAATTRPSGLPSERSSRSASTVVPRARARSSGPTNRPSTPGVAAIGVDVGQGADRLDHDEAAHRGVRRGRVRGGAAPQRRERTPAAVALGRVARRASREHGIRPAGHRRHDDRGGTGIQGGSDPDRVDGRHAHDERGPGIRQAPAGRVQGGAVDRAVLRVERHPVEAARREPPEQVDVGGEGPDAARVLDHPRGDAAPAWSALPYAMWSSASSTAGLAWPGAVDPVKQGRTAARQRRRDARLESSSASHGTRKDWCGSRAPAAPRPVVVPLGSLEQA